MTTLAPQKHIHPRNVHVFKPENEAFLKGKNRAPELDLSSRDQPQGKGRKNEAMARVVKLAFSAWGREVTFLSHLFFFFFFFFF